MKSYTWQFYLCFLNFCEIWHLFPRDPIKNCLWRLLQINNFIIWLSLFSPCDWSICGPSDLIYGHKIPKANAHFAALNHFILKKKRFKESYKTSVNFEDLNVDYVLQHFNLCLMKAMKKLNRNLIEEDSSLCSENFIAVYS